MMSLDTSIIGRIHKGGEKFEIILDKDKAYAYVEGKKNDLANILVVEEVFKDAKKGERASKEELVKVFGTDDVYEITKIILEKGEIQLTTEQKKKMQEEKLKQIIDIIARNAIDVRTKAPVPLKRIELALEEVKFHVDPFKPAEAQVEEALSKLKLVLPLKFAKVKIAVKVPPAYAMKAYGFLKSYGLKKEEWGSQGEPFVLVELPAGMQGEFYDKLNKLTGGEALTKVLEG